MSSCQKCKRDFLQNRPGSVDLMHTNRSFADKYVLGLLDLRQLQQLKDYAFENREVVAMYRWRNDPLHSTQQTPNGSYSAKPHSELITDKYPNSIADGIKRWLENTDSQQHDLFVFRTPIPETPQTLATYNFGSDIENEINQDRWAALSQNHGFMTKPKHFFIRTMVDRDVNLVDLAWVVKLAWLSKNKVDALFLHRENFVWFSWSAYPRYQNDPVYNNTIKMFRHFDKNSMFNLGNTQSKTYQVLDGNGNWVLKRDQSSINSMAAKMFRFNRAQDGRIGVFKYPTFGRRYIFSAEQRPPCPACQRVFMIPKDALTNDFGPHGANAEQLYLTAGDLITMRGLRDRTFGRRPDNNGENVLKGENAPLVAYFYGASNSSAEKELARKMRDDEISYVAGKYTRALNKWLSRLNYIFTGPEDKFLSTIPLSKSNDTGSLTILRTMPDRTARFKDVVTVIELACDRIIDVNAFFLHKYSVLWLAVRPDKGGEGSIAATQAQQVREAMYKNISLRRHFLEEINDLPEMRNLASLKYFRYPARNLMLKLFGIGHEVIYKTGLNDPDTYIASTLIMALGFVLYRYFTTGNIPGWTRSEPGETSSPDLTPSQAPSENQNQPSENQNELLVDGGRPLLGPELYSTPTPAPVQGPPALTPANGQPVPPQPAGPGLGNRMLRMLGRG